MSTRASAANLAQAARNVMLEWEQTKASWRDVKSQEFERTYIEELPDHIARTLAVMEELDGLLRKVRDDCE